MRCPKFRGLQLFALLVGATFFVARPAAAQTTTSTGGLVMPEDGGPLPRAQMPIGGVNDGMKRNTPNKGVDDGMKREGQHCHEHEHDGSKHEHCHDEADKDHGHAHEAEHCHEHEHDGSKHEHCHDEADKDHGHAHEDEHCHEHEHDGSKHAHCHDEADQGHLHGHQRDPVGPAPQVAPTRQGGNFGLIDVPATLSGEGLQVTWNGYFRLLGETVENDSRSTYIGRNDWFKLASARLAMVARTGKLFGFVSIEASAGERESFNDPNATLIVAPRDAFLRYDLARFVDITAGRFKVPYDLGELERVPLRLFIDQPLESRGIEATYGNELRGLSQGRQIGIMLHKDHLGLNADGLDVGYHLALTNGFANGVTLNDNDKPAIFGRVTAYWGELFALNLAGFADYRTVGTLPNLFDEDVLGAEASFAFGWEGLRLQGQMLYTKTQFQTSGQADVNALGGHIAWAYELWGAWLGYRFSYFDPNLDDLDDADAVTEHTIGLGYTMKALPLVFMLNGSVMGEQQGRKVDNNRLTLLTQFSF